jgi:hypothetical protein
MDGVKKLLMEKLLNIGCFKTVGVMIGEKKDLMENLKDILECKEVWILMVLKVFLKLLFQYLLKLHLIVMIIKNFNGIMLKEN